MSCATRPPPGRSVGTQLCHAPPHRHQVGPSFPVRCPLGNEVPRAVSVLWPQLVDDERKVGRVYHPRVHARHQSDSVEAIFLWDATHRLASLRCCDPPLLRILKNHRPPPLVFRRHRVELSDECQELLIGHPPRLARADHSRHHLVDGLHDGGHPRRGQLARLHRPVDATGGRRGVVRKPEGEDLLRAAPRLHAVHGVRLERAAGDSGGDNAEAEVTNVQPHKPIGVKTFERPRLVAHGVHCEDNCRAILDWR
eukprot:CAMPEP_0181351824 /NCGR_PEP_ID=MMETSP1106-20121128/1989_1 /TAXON_ID=81844 /ORGANISM="Mantoniella antarctica, Strain SL-175" /LENGTH=252 /DNA_ID=CAMNT_0023464357 /DNA_START=562 /DNA_END=1317 /DNA_ORIENTATION=-